MTLCCCAAVCTWELWSEAFILKVRGRKQPLRGASCANTKLMGAVAFWKFGVKIKCVFSRRSVGLLSRLAVDRMAPTNAVPLCCSEAGKHTLLLASAASLLLLALSLCPTASPPHTRVCRTSCPGSSHTQLRSYTVTQLHTHYNIRIASIPNARVRFLCKLLKSVLYNVRCEACYTDVTLS